MFPVEGFPATKYADGSAPLFALAAHAASQCVGRALSPGSLVYQVQAHGRVCEHGVQRLRGGAAVRVLGAVQPAGGLPHHHVQQRRASVREYSLSRLRLCCTEFLGVVLVHSLAT